MNRTLRAVRIGLHRGRIEFVNSLHNPGDVGYYLIGTAVFIAVLYNLRNDMIEGTNTSVAVLMFPGFLVMSTAISPLLGLATVVSHRTGGRHPAAMQGPALPRGMQGYVAGQVTRTSLETAFSALLLIVAATIMLPGLWTHAGVLGVLQTAAVWVLGLVACVSIGLAVGSVFKMNRHEFSAGPIRVAALG